MLERKRASASLRCAADISPSGRPFRGTEAGTVQCQRVRSAPANGNDARLRPAADGEARKARAAASTAAPVGRRGSCGARAEREPGGADGSEPQSRCACESSLEVVVVHEASFGAERPSGKNAYSCIAECPRAAPEPAPLADVGLAVGNDGADALGVCEEGLRGVAAQLLASLRSDVVW